MNIFKRKDFFIIIYLALKNNDKSSLNRINSRRKDSADTNEQKELVKF